MSYIRAGKTKHGLSGTSEYIIYKGIKRRCSGRGSDDEKRLYFERGISLCERWESGDGERSGFECFLADMGTRPSPSHSIDRTDNDGIYEPANCQWVLPKEQSRNRRGLHMFTFRGRQMCLAEAAEESGIDPGTLRSRIAKGASIDDATSVPVKRRK